MIEKRKWQEKLSNKQQQQKKGENSWMAYQAIPFQRSQILVSQDITSANSNGILTLFCGKNLR